MTSSLTMTSSLGDPARPCSPSSPLSQWSRVFADLEPTTTSPSPRHDDHCNNNTRRAVFTICPEENPANSPRPPRPELSDLEAEGMVTLTSDWTNDGQRQRHLCRHGTVSSSSAAPFRNKASPHRRGERPDHVHARILASINQKRQLQQRPPDLRTSDETADNAVDDDGLVIVTDKTTQTNQPWMFRDCPSLDDRVDDVNIQNGGDLSKSETNSNSSTRHTHTDSGENGIKDNNVGCDCTESLPREESGIDRMGVSSDMGVSSEAPTLKVEYVGKVWDAYITDFLLASDHISQAAIYDRNTQSCIACSPQFAMSEDELSLLLSCLGSLSLAYRSGLSINGVRYRTVLADGRRGLMAKGEELDGFSACQTRTLLLVALHDRKGKGRRCNEELMRLGDFFWAKGL